MFVNYQVIDQNNVIIRPLQLDSPPEASSYELREEVRARLKDGSLMPPEGAKWTRISEVYWEPGYTGEQPFQPLRFPPHAHASRRSPRKSAIAELYREQAAIDFKVASGKTAEDDFFEGGGLRIDEFTDGAHSDRSRCLQRISISPGADRRESDAPKIVFTGNLQRAPVTGCQQFRLSTVSTAPHRTDGVNHMSSRQVVALGDLGVSGSQPPNVRHSSNKPGPPCGGWRRPRPLPRATKCSRHSQWHPPGES